MVLLLPGFLASTILNLILVRRPEENLARFIEALILTFVIYAILYGFLRIEPWGSSGPALFNPRFLGSAVLLSLFLPMLIGLLVTTDVHMKLLRALHVTSKTARDTA